MIAFFYVLLVDMKTNIIGINEKYIRLVTKYSALMVIRDSAGRGVGGFRDGSYDRSFRRSQLLLSAIKDSRISPYRK